ncbi:type II toxin-antitoxin system ParD family antitoxin [Phenylobacterium sp.]|jgi:antitoxin ParD1/3/4|uniref:type II toxin-antitoxin system ParD family antitoxin n=1 Tax=Phenylobacterium sp. TaxID=1871053 RepID=UPI0035AE0270
MSKVEKVSVALTPELLESIRYAVDSGDYASSSEVVREAVRDWVGKREERAAKLADLRAAIQAGIDSGPAPHHRTAEEIIAEGRRRLANRG